jgi:hypothetical protein
MTPKKPDNADIGMGMSISKPEAIVALIRQLKVMEQNYYWTLQL